MSPNELAVTIATMRKFGGSFVRRLADLLAVADPENATRLIAAFPEHFKKYGPGSDPFIATMFGGEVAA